MEFEKHVKIRREKFGAVLFETLREKVFVTNETGAEILKLLQERNEPERIATLLTQNYQGDSERIKSEALEFIVELTENNLIRRA
jgi:precorrin-6B methylase 1